MRICFSRLLALSAVVVLSLQLSVSAELITSFETGDLDDMPSNDISDTPTTVAANVTSADLTFGAGLSGLNWPRTLDVNGLFGVADLDAAISGNKYVTTTITPDSGYEIDFSNFHVILGVNVGTTAGENTAVLMSSLTGFTSADALATFEPVTTANGVVVNTTYNFDLSGVASLQGVDSAVEFRLYYGPVGNRIGIGNPFDATLQDDFSLSGTVTAVPEPSSLILLGFACIGGLFFRARVK